MKRRGNKSHKVPNVKLRPAQRAPPAWKTDSDTTQEELFVQDSQSINSVLPSTCPRPFLNMVICATGVPEKPTLFHKAEILGALTVNDFTDRVTHLIASSHGGAKYRVALENGVPILTPSWIGACHDVWLKGDDVDVEETVKQHRLPIFSDIVLCLSGVQDIALRTKIGKLVTRNQGEYVKAIERPVRVTHLLCSGEEKTEKMIYAEKFNDRKEADIKIVWEEWFWDSLEFGGRFDEEDYSLDKPRPSRRVFEAPITQALEPTSSILEPGDILSTNPGQVSARTQRHSNALDDDDEELAAVSRVPEGKLRFWESLLKPRGFEVTTTGNLQRSPGKEKATTRRAYLEEEPINQGSNTRSVISSFRAGNSFLQEPRPLQRTNTAGMSITASTSRLGGQQSSVNQRQQQGLFSGLRLLVLGEARSPSVQKAIEDAGGKYMSPDMEDEGEPDYIVVRLVSGSKLFREEADIYRKSKYRTECWLERSIFDKRVCNPEDHVSFVPLSMDLPIPGAERITLSFSGLDESENYFARRLIRALGLTLLPRFMKDASLLICPSATGAKFEKACEWGIPVVHLNWLESISRTGIIPSTDDFKVTAGPSSSDDKGKGKASIFAEDTIMVEVTNTRDDLPEFSDGQPSRFKTAPISFGKPVRLLKAESLDATRNTTSRNSILEDPVRRSISQPTRPSNIQPAQLAVPNSDLPRTTTPTPIETRMSLLHTSSSGYLAQKGQSGDIAHDQELPQIYPSDLDLPQISPDDDDLQHLERIPSSSSPSPMKLQEVNRLAKKPQPISPIKVAPPTEEATKMLQDNIMSLLGKRSSNTEDEGTSSRSKRARPARSKPKARALIREPSAAQQFDFGQLDEQNLYRPGEEDVLPDTTRVVYDESIEQRQLMKMLDPDSQEKVPGKSRAPNKRSSRLAGF